MPMTERDSFEAWWHVKYGHISNMKMHDAALAAWQERGRLAAEEVLAAEQAGFDEGWNACASETMSDAEREIIRANGKGALQRFVAEAVRKARLEEREACITLITEWRDDENSDQAMHRDAGEPSAALFAGARARVLDELINELTTLLALAANDAGGGAT